MSQNFIFFFFTLIFFFFFFFYKIYSLPLGNKSLQVLSSHTSHGGSKSSLHLLKASKEGKLKRSPSKESIDSNVSVESSLLLNAGNASQFDQVYKSLIELKEKDSTHPR